MCKKQQNQKQANWLKKGHQHWRKLQNAEIGGDFTNYTGIIGIFINIIWKTQLISL
jgi:hypothetical protein